MSVCLFVRMVVCPYAWQPKSLWYFLSVLLDRWSPRPEKPSRAPPPQHATPAGVSQSVQRANIDRIRHAKPDSTVQRKNDSVGRAGAAASRAVEHETGSRFESSQCSKKSWPQRTNVLPSTRVSQNIKMVLNGYNFSSITF